MPEHRRDDDHDREALEKLAEEFVRRHRAGERPSVNEYASAHPQHAAEILELFPTLMVMENLALTEDDSPAGGANRLAALQAAPPERVGDYRILREIGRGGMGVVYEAEQESLGRHVALKLLRLGGPRDAHLLERFRRESRAAARLHHTNIVPVFEVGEEGNLCFYAMQFIQGQALDQVLKELVELRGHPGGNGQSAGSEPPRIGATGSVASSLWIAPFSATEAVVREGREAPGDGEHRSGEVSKPPSSELSAAGSNFRLYCRNVARIGQQVADALGYAHARGVFHRDIKPSNLLLDASGVAWVTDFGLAKTEGHSLTQVGDIIGTIRYMAPERFRGEGDARADIYALGLTLYELLVLRPAFEGDDRLQLIEQISKRQPARPRSLEPRVPLDLETIVHKATEKDPGRRYPTATELAEDLKRFLDDRPIRARRVGLRERLWRSCRRSPYVASLIAAVAALLLLAAFGSTWAAWRFRRLAGDLETNLYYERIAVAHHELTTNPPDIGRAERLLGECPDRLRGWEWHYLKRSWLVEPAVLTDPKVGQVYCASFSGDGRFLASGGGDGKVTVREVSGRRVVQTLSGHSAYVHSVAFSPVEGDLLASSSHDGTVKLWSRRTGAALFTWPGNRGREYGTAYGLAFSPDGNRLATGGEGGTAKVWSTRNGNEELSLPGHDSLMLCAAFSPDGTRLVTGDYAGWVRIWDAQSGRLLRSILGKSHPISCVAFSPDGSRLAVSSFNHHVRLLDAASDRILRSFRAHTHLALGLSFSPDGRRLATCGADGDVKVWDLTRQREALVLRAPAAMRFCVAFSSDGCRLASGDFDGAVRSHGTPLVGDEGTGRMTLEQPVSVWALAVSPDGRRIATGGDHFTEAVQGEVPVSLLDASTGVLDRRLGGQASIIFDLAFSPDGRYLASVGAQGQRRAIVWDWQTGQEGPRVEGSQEVAGALFAIAFSPDGRYLVACGESGEVRAWDAKTGRRLGLLGTHARECVDLEFSDDGAHLASLSQEGTVKLWDGKRLDQRQEALAVVYSKSVSGTGISNALAFSHDGKRLFVGSDEGTVTIWEVATGGLLQSLPGGTFNSSAIAISPDGKWLASGGTDSTVRIRDAGSGETLRTFRGHRGAVFRVAFLPGAGGERLISGSRDGTVKIWDPENR